MIFEVVVGKMVPREGLAEKIAGSVSITRFSIFVLISMLFFNIITAVSKLPAMQRFDTTLCSFTYCDATEALGPSGKRVDEFQATELRPAPTRAIKL